jgi:hypothetical protein
MSAPMIQNRNYFLVRACRWHQAAIVGKRRCGIAVFSQDVVKVVSSTIASTYWSSQGGSGSRRNHCVGRPDRSILRTDGDVHGMLCSRTRESPQAQRRSVAASQYPICWKAACAKAATAGDGGTRGYAGHGCCGPCASTKRSPTFLRCRTASPLRLSGLWQSASRRLSNAGAHKADGKS